MKKIYAFVCLWITLFCFPKAFGQTVTPPVGMLSPRTDIAAKEWSYLAKSTTVIGMPFQSDVTQVTFDGALYTRYAELCFFWGAKQKPLLARQKTFLKGWIPVVQYDWADDGLKYEMEYFSDYIGESGNAPVVNFAKVRITNTGNRPSVAYWTAALRFSGQDYRMGGDAYSYSEKFSSEWSYEMKGDAVYRDKQLIYTFEKGGTLQSVPGVRYEKPFNGRTYQISPRAECCLSAYQRRLKPGESMELLFKMPRVPVAARDETLANKIQQASYKRHRSGVIRYWADLVKNGSQFDIPEPRMENAYKAGIVHALLATRNRNGKSFQTDGLPYPDFFLTSVPEMTMLYLSAGMPRMLTQYIIPGAIAQQQENGLYFDKAVAHNKIIPATQGHILYAIAMTILYTRDTAFARSVYASIAKGVGFLQRSIDSSQYGLLPPCYAYDAEMITGHYSGQNFFALMGLRTCIRVARLLNKKEDTENWTLLARRYEANILKALDASVKKDGYVPAGLYHYLTGQAARKGFEEYQTNNDWENMILAYPTEVLQPSDYRVLATVNHIRKSYAEGVMTYRHGMHLHQYITSNMIQQYLAMGDGFTALKDFYHQLLHSGSTMECFENLVTPWADRSVAADCPPPHAWGNSKQAITVRNLLLMEMGGKNGLEMDKRELWLFHCLSPQWVGKGKKIGIKNATTEFGRLDASFESVAGGAIIKIANRFHTSPAFYRVRVPYFKRLIRFSSDAKVQKREGDCILLSTDAKILQLRWEDIPSVHLHTRENILNEYRSANRFAGVKDGKAIIEKRQPYTLANEHSEVAQPLGFELVKNTFLYEYNRLAREREGKGAILKQVEAPAMLTAKEREQLFEQLNKK
ncbi:hypothetical protein [Niabella aurantiaca]|uniref:hypothetical protein n=1 Tax=Niabella aurantiaca TaxID=379900 RepID=UPI000380FB85|nr:hypothetical protein [Niabella aurantiaca]